MDAALVGADDDLPDFFKMSIAGSGDGMTTRSGRGADGGAGGRRGDNLKSTSLLDALTVFEGDTSDPNGLFASLGLPLGGQSSGAGTGLGGLSGGGGGTEQDIGSFGTHQSEWARMQKQFEDMNKSFLQE